MTNGIDIIIVGAHKCASSALFSTILQHKDIQSHYGNQLEEFLHKDEYKDVYRDILLKEYGNSGSGKLNLARDMTVYCNPLYIRRLYEIAPNAKLILAVRDPVQRAVSSYHYSRENRFNTNDLTINEVIDAWLGSSAEGSTLPINNHIESGMYYKHLTSMIKYFSPQKILIVKQEDLAKDQQKVADKIFQFVGLEKINIKSVVKNQSSKNRFMWLHLFMRDSNGLLKTLLRTLLPKLFRTYLYHSIININRKKASYPVVSDYSKERLKRIYLKDLQGLKRKFNIDYL